MKTAELAGYPMEVPFGPAAGVLTGANEEVLLNQTKDVLRSPASVAWWGSFTWNGGQGNEPEYGEVYYHNRLTGLTYNSMGLPNIGSQRAMVLYPSMKEQGDAHGTLLIPSVSPGKGEDPLEVLPRMAEGFAEAGAPVIEVNYSCPNKFKKSGWREPILCFDLPAMEAAQAEVVRRVGNDVLVIAKVAPYLDQRTELIPKVAELFARVGGNYGLGLSNTIGGEKGRRENGNYALPNVPDNEGGMSGRSVGSVGLGQLVRFNQFVEADVPKASYLGVEDASDVLHRERLGAIVCGGVTVFKQNETHGISFGRTCHRFTESYVAAMEARSQR
jgi:dihydroorotate dehydrogenase